MKDLETLQILPSYKTKFFLSSCKIQPDSNNTRKRDILIEKLDVSNCNLLKVPSSVYHLKYIKVLNLSNNFITDLCNDIKNLRNLTVLNLSGNKLTSLPKFLKHVSQLSYLNLSHNDFSEVPDVLSFGLRKIKILDLSFNQFNNFKNRPDCLSNLIELRLSNTLIENLPSWIFDSLCQLQILDFSCTMIDFNPQPFMTFYKCGIFNSLRILKLENCSINSEKLKFLSYFNNLETLYLGNSNESVLYKKNYFGDLNISILKNSVNLTHLYAENTQISFLSGDLKIAPKIKFLNLPNNTLSWLPESFCFITSLEILNLTSNQIIFLPNKIDHLVNLKQIFLADNCLYELPEVFCGLKNLEYVDLYNNEIEIVDLKFFKIKNLKGVDLGMNNLDFKQLQFNDCVEVKKQYNMLKETFREHFNYKNSRSDYQALKIKEIERNKKFSFSSHDSFKSDSQGSLDCELLGNEEIFPDEENWEEENVTAFDEDEIFDPNEIENTKKKCLPFKVSWINFEENFCPANSHVSSIIRTYKRNLNSAIKNFTVEEGQFDD